MCAVVASWLRDLKVSYREIDVTDRPNARRILRALTHGELSVPTVVLADGRVLVEPSRKALFEALRQRPR
jgi:glutaredoxin